MSFTSIFTEDEEKCERCYCLKSLLKRKVNNSWIYPIKYSPFLHPDTDSIYFCPSTDRENYIFLCEIVSLISFFLDKKWMACINMRYIGIWKICINYLKLFYNQSLIKIRQCAKWVRGIQWMKTMRWLKIAIGPHYLKPSLL